MGDWHNGDLSNCMAGQGALFQFAVERLPFLPDQSDRPDGGARLRCAYPGRMERIAMGERRRKSHAAMVAQALPISLRKPRDSGCHLWSGFRNRQLATSSYGCRLASEAK
jgi:hypothetical protein